VLIYYNTQSKIEGKPIRDDSNLVSRLSVGNKTPDVIAVMKP